MGDDYKFNYLKIFNVKRYLGVGQYCVTRNKLISSDRWNSFQKNLRKAYKVWILITGVFKFLKMVHCSSWSNFGDFREPKFPSFSTEGSGRKYLGKLILMVFECYTCKEFCYLFIFVMFWKLIFAWVCQMIFRDLGVMTSRIFCYRGYC